MLILFASAVFLGAGLLFLVQPMAAKMVLPSLGGSPAVWNTCMVFFQAALLAGYAYAHWAPRVLGRRHPLVHAAVVLAPLLALPIALRGGTPSGGGSPVLWLLGALSLSVGAPFLVAATGAPLMQRWFSRTGHTAASDPYFLYVASNAGSLLALLAYPLGFEPYLTLPRQRAVWSAGYVVLALLTVACAVVTHRRASVPQAHAPADPGDDSPTWRARLFWVAASMAPSSYLLGVTQFLSTDIAAVPLLWVVPLGVYLLTFMLAFSRRPLAPVGSLSKILPLLVIGLAVAIVMAAKRPVWIVVVLHLGTFFTAALLCHGRLAASRPRASRLTEFYLLIALGGVLGGLFNALAAPVLFRTVAEYPLALFAVCLFRVGRTRDAASLGERLLIDAALGLGLTVILVLGSDMVLRQFASLLFDPAGNLKGTGLTRDQFALILVVGVPSVIAYLYSSRPVRFALALGVLLWIGHTESGPGGRTLRLERTFFGVYHVTDDGEKHMLVHGTTEHGAQFIDAERRGVPLTYYHPDGPIGQVFSVLGDHAGERAAFVGMGTGALAAYGHAGRRFTFFEIDPAVVRIAEDPGLFTYLSDARARGLVYDVVLGDGRLSIRDHARDGEFTLIVLDAFTSDAIPVHLMTREATELYLRKLRPGDDRGGGGILAFHISNQYLDLAPVLAAIARDLGLAAIDGYDFVRDVEMRRSGRSTSHWILLARRAADFGPLSTDPRWEPLAMPPNAPRWTDDHSNILGVFRWD